MSGRQGRAGHRYLWDGLIALLMGLVSLLAALPFGVSTWDAGLALSSMWGSAAFLASLVLTAMSLAGGLIALFASFLLLTAALAAVLHPRPEMP
jgi:hypothetical protein